MRPSRQTSLWCCLWFLPCFPPVSPSITWRNTSADALTACSLFVKIYSRWSVFRQKKERKKRNSERPLTPLKLSFPAFRKPCRRMLKLRGSRCFLHRLPDMFIRCCRGAKLQIDKAISTTQPSTLAGEDLLDATAAGPHWDLIISMWLSWYHASVGISPS